MELPLDLAGSQPVGPAAHGMCGAADARLAALAGAGRTECPGAAAPRRRAAAPDKTGLHIVRCVPLEGGHSLAPIISAVGRARHGVRCCALGVGHGGVERRPVGIAGSRTARLGTRY